MYLLFSSSYSDFFVFLLTMPTSSAEYPVIKVQGEGGNEHSMCLCLTGTEVEMAGHMLSAYCLLAFPGFRAAWIQLATCEA